VFGKHSGGVQGRRVDVHHREFLVDLCCPQNDLRAESTASLLGSAAWILADRPEIQQ
jgi:hypothetical protein